MRALLRGGGWPEEGGGRRGYAFYRKYSPGNSAALCARLPVFPLFVLPSSVCSLFLSRYRPGFQSAGGVQWCAPPDDVVSAVLLKAVRVRSKRTVVAACGDIPALIWW